MPSAAASPPPRPTVKFRIMLTLWLEKVGSQNRPPQVRSKTSHAFVEAED
jgi:hypothetical protein